MNVCVPDVFLQYPAPVHIQVLVNIGDREQAPEKLVAEKVPPLLVKLMELTLVKGQVHVLVEPHAHEQPLVFLVSMGKKPFALDPSQL